jgi:hypothetical protein
MKFWDTTEINSENPIWNEYKLATTKDAKKRVLINLMETYPKIIDYLWNRAETCFGEHNAYLVHITYKGVNYLKIGYTKNTIEERFGESRYEGAGDMKLIKVIRIAKLQAQGAVEFEGMIKKRIQSIKTEMKMPGKGELFDMNNEPELCELWDREIHKYNNIVGIKSPN